MNKQLGMYFDEKKCNYNAVEREKDQSRHRESNADYTIAIRQFTHWAKKS